MSGKIDGSRGQLNTFRDVFSTFDDEFLVGVNRCIPASRIEQNIWGNRASFVILEEMFTMAISGMRAPPMLEVDHWLQKHGESTCARHGIPLPDVSVHFLKEKVVDYHHAASRMLHQLAPRASEVRFHTTYTHPKLGIDFTSMFEMDGVVFVSIHECPKPEFSMLYHTIGAAFDPRKRMFVHEYVFRLTDTDLVFTLAHPAERGALLWDIAARIALNSNRTIKGLLFAFDLEWNNPDTKTRYQKGTIVDAHFEDVSTGWVLHTGTINPQEAIADLTPFLLNHGYSNETLLDSRCTIGQLKDKIDYGLRITDGCIFTAFNGVNGDLNILRAQGIHLPRYVDASFLLTGGVSQSLLKLYEAVFGSSFDSHRAWSDTVALIELIKHKNTSYEQVRLIWDTIKFIA